MHPEVISCSRMDRKAVLKTVALFEGLSESDIDALSARVTHKRAARGELLFSEGDSAHGLYIVEEGSVKIFKLSASGREQVLHIEQPGQSFAEIPLFDGGPYPASAAAMEESVLMYVNKKDFDELCLTHPQIALTVIRVIGARLRRLTQLIEEISLKDVTHRLAWWLLERVRAAGLAGGKNADIPVDLSHGEIAAQIGTVREVVSRTISRLESDGILHFSGRLVQIPDLKRLEEIVAE